MTTPPPTILRLTGLKTSALPPASATADQLTPLITTLLQEALPLLDSTTTAPALWKSKGTKQHPASTAPIHLTERVLAGETWACRRSVHADAPQPGTASWAEFARCLRDEHAATEDAFTPTVLAHREARVWGAAAAVAPVVIAVEEGGSTTRRRWGGFALALVEMKHRIPPPLKPRVFPVLQLAARAVAAGGEGEGELDDFVVVSVPVGDLAEQKEEEELGVLCREKGVVVGAYAAVERVRRIEGEGGDGKAKKEIEWVMATASDARGVLPMFVQTKAVPAQIAKDVSLFLGWIDGERRKEGAKTVGGGQQEQAGNGHSSAVA